MTTLILLYLVLYESLVNLIMVHFAWVILSTQLGKSTLYKFLGWVKLQFTTMSCIVTYSQMQIGAGILPGGKGEPPLKYNGQQSPKDPHNETRPSKRSQKRVRAWQAKLFSQKPQSKANPSMPGELTFSQMLSNVDMSLDRITEILIDSLSSSTPQQTKHESSRVFNNPTSCLRMESPLMQVYTEGITPLRDHPKGINAQRKELFSLICKWCWQL